MIKITKKMNGKMQGMVSINTSSLDNKYCLAMSKTPNIVCGSCYSNRMLKIYKTARAAFKHNSEVLNSHIIPLADLPRINAHTVRFDAYGELDTIYQLINYINICAVNPKSQFTLWTKRTNLVAKAIRDYGKPRNLILIYSSPEVDIREKRPQHFDKVFTVYSAGHKAKINCGTKKCIDCMTCYTKSNRTIYINERIK